MFTFRSTGKVASKIPPAKLGGLDEVKWWRLISFAEFPGVMPMTERQNNTLYKEAFYKLLLNI